MSDEHLTFEYRITELSMCFYKYNLVFKIRQWQVVTFKLKLRDYKREVPSRQKEKIITHVRAIKFIHALGSVV